MTQARLVRRLGLADAVGIGISAMLGAGIFAVFSPAARLAGTWLLLSIAIAGLIALINATSMAQLSQQYPAAGGNYHYAREQLGNLPGFLAGWGFVVGKLASVAAMALTLGAYLAPPAGQRLVAIAAIISVTIINSLGVKRTARVTMITSAVVVLGVVAAGLAVWLGSPPVIVSFAAPPNWYGILSASGLIFFAFAGYARITTLGEEVKNPQRVIPLAILIAITAVGGLYLGVAWTLLAHAAPAQIMASDTPLIALLATGTWPTLALGVPPLAALACFGALLGLTAGIGRTIFAMARNRDLPASLAYLNRRFATPRAADALIAVIAIAAVVFGDVLLVIGLSSFGVLTYYALAHAAAYTQKGSARYSSRLLQVAGLLGCVTLIATLPTPAIVAGMIMFGVGLAYWYGSRRIRRA